ncbi:2OG-Fe(II) oxygenase [Streptomyces parvulus]|uniref:2OG-Fe(II) oxygenase n=1 Tax=Streptomyces parvulus TaxID=146923 RepID=UPI003455159D
MLRKDTPVLHVDFPYTLHLAQELLTKDVVSELYATAPVKRTATISSTDPEHEKLYRMNLLYLMVNNRRREISDELPASWRSLLDDLASADFTTWLSESTGIDLHGFSQDISVYTHVDGDFISVHKDKAGKAITVILHLTPEWPTSAGGEFEVHFSGDPDDDRVFRISPRPGQLLAFPPTDKSWHAVSRVHCGGTFTRLTVQVEYWFEHVDRYGTSVVQDPGPETKNPELRPCLP